MSSSLVVLNTHKLLNVDHIHNEQYNELRSDLFNSVNAILFPSGFSSLPNEVLLKFILYGDKRFTIVSSKKLLEATQKFIHASERF